MGTKLCMGLSPTNFLGIGVVRRTGHIVKCFDEMVDSFLVSDELRKAS